ncbi:hypothetical protein HID58_014026 [Brassica napus]|uniref:Uncharacterized protein n=2 Tax=Brassica TaxID=3705 RepID=A0A3P5YG37_BRACM|nr:hypothetical protein HID58_014026 [Brassica napus]CAG7864893.1 unnamed protein product [Brassica rapa]CAF2265230.1 unnamed protein product [Brassica napus]CAG7869910.1 unnamed protein product [Brassica rapa]CAG7905345.1 unnamed protein product [Brassica rapa]
MRKLSNDEEMDEIGIEVSGLNYESDELNKSSKTTKSVQNGGGNVRIECLLRIRWLRRGGGG